MGAAEAYCGAGPEGLLSGVGAFAGPPLELLLRRAKTAMTARKTTTVRTMMMK